MPIRKLGRQNITENGAGLKQSKSNKTYRTIERYNHCKNNEQLHPGFMIAEEIYGVLQLRRRKENEEKNYINYNVSDNADHECHISNRYNCIC